MEAPEAGRPDPREALRRRFDPEELAEIRELWKEHSIAEERRDLAGLLATLTEDCLYELVESARTWEGHDGARRFYLELLGAFPDIRFDLVDIVIGPQGVCEEALVTATHQGDWLDRRATGESVAFPVVIFSPWDRKRRRFRGERIHLVGLEG